MTSPPSTWQSCDECGHQLDELDAADRCPRCGGLLAVVHRVQCDGLRARLDADRSPSGVWRFAELILPGGAADAVSYPEGDTPLLDRDALRRWTGLDNLFIKHDGLNPTGSFKDRGMTVAITQAKRIGARAVACASTGNTSASLAAYAAQAGLPALAFMPEGQVAAGKLAQTLAYGAHTLLVAGDFDACLALMQQARGALGVYLVNSINPFRLEGQKSAVFEILAQFGWLPPDWIVLPAGNLGNTAAFGKAIDEAVELGLIARRPRLVSVQAAGAAPFAAAFARGFDRLDNVVPETVATAIRIGAPASYRRAVHAIQATDGIVMTATDAEILEAKIRVDRAGVGCEPASAAAVAGARKLRLEGVIRPGDSVVCVLTGHLLKDPGIVQQIHGSPSLAPEFANVPLRVRNDLDDVRRVLAGFLP
ncbi:MAG: threonine synthase [Gemmatimonadales bacterium]